MLRFMVLALSIGGCSLTGCDGGSGPPAADTERFGAFTAGTTWTYAIDWVRGGACSGHRIRAIRLEQAAPAGGDTLRLVYAWSDVERPRDSAVTYPEDCDSVDTSLLRDTVLLDPLSRYVIPDTVSDAKGFADLRAMSFFQVKPVPSDTGVLCDGKTKPLRTVSFAGEGRGQMIDTSACLNGPHDSASFVRYQRGVGLVGKRWGYTDESVRIDFTSIRLLEFNGRAFPPELVP